MAKSTDKKPDAVMAQHEAIGISDDNLYGKNSNPTDHPEAQWFPGAGLGLFVHWGISALHGGIDISWGMMANTTWDEGAKNKNKISPREYFSLAEKFNPDKYDPFKWLEAAADAGFKYAVLTTKHHDGFALWPSKYGDFNTKNFMGGRDLVNSFVEACRKYGLKVGIYYSPPDWYYNREYMSFNFGSDEYYKSDNPEKFKDRKHFDLDHREVELPEKPPNWHQGYIEYLKNQIEELLTEYGKIDLLWFDGGPDAISINRIRELQPGIVINPRMHGEGDFKTPEVGMPENKLTGWWELCHMWNMGGWGYTLPERYQSTESVLSILAKVRSWGGNLLINCAPRPNGEMPDLYYERLGELAKWMEKNKESIFNTEPGPYPESSNMPITQKNNKWYIHLESTDTDRIILTDVKDPEKAFLLNTGEQVRYHYHKETLTINISEDNKLSINDVICIEWR